MTWTLAKPGIVHFAWTYSAKLSSDTYQYQLSTDPPHVGHVPFVDIPLGGKTQLCLRVKVFRADGSNPPADWSAPGCYSNPSPGNG